MFGEGSMAEAAMAETPGRAVLIIPEVAVETRQLVFVLEIDLIAVPPT
jgi:hypothetical protein